MKLTHKLSFGWMIITATACLLGARALASESATPSKPDLAYVDISAVPLPIAADGRLINYIFAQVRVNLKPSANILKLREKEPFLRDALIRAAHTTPFTAADSYAHLDEAKLKAAVLVSAREILGASNVAGVTIMKQTAKTVTGLPKPPGAH